jgi:hypothetical protein
MAPPNALAKTMTAIVVDMRLSVKGWDLRFEVQERRVKDWAACQGRVVRPAR